MLFGVFGDFGDLGFKAFEEVELVMLELREVVFGEEGTFVFAPVGLFGELGVFVLGRMVAEVGFVLGLFVFLDLVELRLSEEFVFLLLDLDELVDCFVALLVFLLQAAHDRGFLGFGSPVGSPAG